MSWIPLSSGVIKSSLWAEEDWVIKIFLTMLADKGPGDIYTASAYALAHDARKTEEQVLEAWQILSGPDRLRKEPQGAAGARIRKVEGGWHIINAAEYRKRMSEELKRYRNAKAQKAWRQKQAQIKGPTSRERAFVKSDGDGDFETADALSAPGVDLESPPVETVTNSPATSIRPNESEHRPSSRPATPSPTPVPERKNRALAATSGAASVDPAPSPAGRPASPSPQDVQPVVEGTPTNNSATTTKSRSQVQAVQSGRSVPSPAVKTGDRLVDPVLTRIQAARAPRPAPVDPRKVDTMPRDSAGMVANTGGGSMFSDWGERTIAKPGQTSPRTPGPTAPAKATPAPAPSPEEELQQLSEEPPVA